MSGLRGDRLRILNLSSILLDHLAYHLMGDYCAPARGTMEIMRPEGHIMPPEGCNMPCQRQPEGSIMQPEGGIMFPEGLHDFHWPEGRAQ